MYLQRLDVRLSQEFLDPDEEITRVLTTDNPQEAKNLVIFSNHVGVCGEIGEKNQIDLNRINNLYLS